MRTCQSGRDTLRSMLRHGATILFCALAALGLMRCAEPVGVPAADEMALLERFVAMANPSSELLASMKPLLATERGQQMLRSIRSRDVNVVPRFTHSPYCGPISRRMPPAGSGMAWPVSRPTGASSCTIRTFRSGPPAERTGSTCSLSCSRGPRHRDSLAGRPIQQPPAHAGHRERYGH